MTNRITVTIYGNESMIGVHTKTVMDANPHSFNDEKPKAKRLLGFVKKLNDLRGVKRADVWKYEVRIERADAFDWNEIVPGIVAVVAKFCRYDIYELRIEDQRSTYNHDSDGFPSGRRENPNVDLGITANNPYAGVAAAFVEAIDAINEAA